MVIGEAIDQFLKEAGLKFFEGRFYVEGDTVRVEGVTYQAKGFPIKHTMPNMSFKTLPAMSRKQRVRDDGQTFQNNILQNQED